MIDVPEGDIEGNLVVSGLRRLADAIERGNFGLVETAVLVINGENVNVFPLGDKAGKAHAVMALQLGSQLLLEPLVRAASPFGEA
ncbi:hypothetical protein EOD42_16960 [Rhodovarius crocodyli]|uniref:Uncharacterized protein n=1 Tax=Rhodovarius crocodyli TaxID=1979269 RepID=A0A437MCA0_9PROT|nr:hypothetical protein [Rhodovarius crocodyli]RVT95274.1 hypothetical protein EOD42_16960 [Rhodovarius crocodyli]